MSDTRMTIRFPDELHARITAQAVANRRSFSNVVLRLLESHPALPGTSATSPRPGDSATSRSGPDRR